MESKAKRNTKSIGDRSEMMAILALVESGYDVSVPFGENHRYDLIADKDGVLWRIQVKTGRFRKGAVVFNAYSSHAHRNGGCRSYAGEIDCFAVYCTELRSVYLIPIADTARLHGSLRVDATRNAQSRRIRWADRYLLGTFQATGRDSVDLWSTVNGPKSCPPS